MKFVLLIIGILLLIGTSSAWVPGYDYRVPIEFNNTGNNLTYTIHNFTFNTATEIAAGNMTYANGSDFIITNATDVLHEFWNETAFNLSDTLFWINASSLGNVSNTTYYGYFGNSSKTTSSANISTTMLFGDDFESGNLNQWDQPAGGTITSTAGEVYTGNYAVKTNQDVNNFYEDLSFGSTLVIEANVKQTVSGGGWFGTIVGNTYDSNSRLVSNQSDEYRVYDGNIHNTGVPWTDYTKVKMVVNSTSVKYYSNGVLAYTTSSSSNPAKLVLYDIYSNWIYMDNIFVYEYVEVEPTWSTWAVEKYSSVNILSCSNDIILDNSVVVSWQTDDNSNSRLYHGCDAADTANFINGSWSVWVYNQTNISIHQHGLSGNTLYYWAPYSESLTGDSSDDEFLLEFKTPVSSVPGGDIMELGQYILLVALLFLSTKLGRNVLFASASVLYVVYLLVYVTVGESMIMTGFFILIMCYFMLGLIQRQHGGKK